MSVSHAILDSDSVTKACDLLERLGEIFSPENVDYQFAEGGNRFLVRYAGVWHAVAFSDTTLLVRALAELEEEISRVIYGRGSPCSEPTIREIRP